MASNFCTAANAIGEIMAEFCCAPWNDVG